MNEGNVWNLPHLDSKDVCNPPEEALSPGPVLYNNLDSNVSDFMEFDAPVQWPEGRLTRSLAREQNTEVADHRLPVHCPTSKRYRVQDG